MDERDKYMSSILKSLAQKHPVTIAVVGKGHVQGIKKYWNEDIDIEALKLLPEKRAIPQLRLIYVSVGVGIAALACVRWYMKSPTTRR